MCSWKAHKNSFFVNNDIVYFSSQKFNGREESKYISSLSSRKELEKRKYICETATAVLTLADKNSMVDNCLK